MQRLLFLSFLCPLVLLGPVSCGGDDESGEEAAAQGDPAAKKKGKADDAADEDERPSMAGEPVVAGSFVYNPIGKRDPFRSFISGRLDEEIRAPTPLQRFDIEELLLVGIVWGIDHPRALIADPDQTSHVVERGTYIGKNWGKVSEITSRAVVITEEYQTIEGELVTEQVVMNLPIEDDF
jgi:type IV pilus assembly protein PilP